MSHVRIGTLLVGSALAVATIVLACGSPASSSGADDPDAEKGEEESFDSATSEGGAAPLPSTYPDGAPRPPEPDPLPQDTTDYGQRINDGTDCVFRTDASIEKGNVRSCCGGKPCEGHCVLFEGETTPTCSCFRIRGGCGENQMCCSGERTGCVSDTDVCGPLRH